MVQKRSERSHLSQTRTIIIKQRSWFETTLTGDLRCIAEMHRWDPAGSLKRMHTKQEVHQVQVVIACTSFPLCTSWHIDGYLFLFSCESDVYAYTDHGWYEVSGVVLMPSNNTTLNKWFKSVFLLHFLHARQHSNCWHNFFSGIVIS